MFDQKQKSTFFVGHPVYIRWIESFTLGIFYFVILFALNLAQIVVKRRQISRQQISEFPCASGKFEKLQELIPNYSQIVLLH